MNRLKTILARRLASLWRPITACALALTQALPLAALALDCETGIDGDPDQLAYGEEYDFGTDWAIQINEQTLKDMLLRQLDALQDSGQYLHHAESISLAFFNIGYELRVQGLEVTILPGGHVVFELLVEGYAFFGSNICPVDGVLEIEVEPMLTDDPSGDQILIFPPVDIHQENPAYTGTPNDCPFLCAYGGTTWGSLLCSHFDSAIGTMINKLQVNLTQLLGGLPVDQTLDSELGWVDPFEALELSVVGDAVDGGDPFVMIGGQLVAAEACTSDAFPLFDPDRFHDFRTNLIANDAVMLFSMRMTEILEAELNGLFSWVSEAAPDALIMGALEAKPDHITLWYSGLHSNDPPCACAMGDTEYWLALEEPDPMLEFRSFILVYINTSILGWEPGPVTLQLNGWVEFHVEPPVVGGTPRIGLALGFSRANVYGPWWADTVAWFLNNNPFGANMDIQDAGFYNDYLVLYFEEGPDGDGAFIPLDYFLGADSDAFEAPGSPGLGYFVTAPDEAFLHANAFHWAYRWTQPTTPDEYWASCGLDSDNDGLSDAEEAAWGTDPADRDTDGDLLNDGLEIEIGTDPASCDTDGDGASDWAEYFRMGTFVDDPDSDGDGVLDGCEDVVTALDPLDDDSNDDGIPDGLGGLATLYCGCGGLPCPLPGCP